MRRHRETVTRDEVVEVLREANPRARLEQLVTYAANFLTWLDASRHLAQDGAIVPSPRTGTPAESPYLRIRAAAVVGMARAKLRHTDPVWRRWASSED